MLIPYSNRVPGSDSCGEVNTASLPGMMFGVPVTCSYRSMSRFQNQ